MKKCETFGCPNPAVQMLMIAPATNVWLCAKCVAENQEAQDDRPATGRDMRPAA